MNNKQAIGNDQTKGNTNSPRKACGYYRFSSANQTENSIEYQKARVNLYCAEHSIEIVDEYIDRAMSGTTDRREGFQSMIAAAMQNPNWDLVVVYDLSRFGRNNSDVIKYRDILADCGIELLSVTQDFGKSCEGRLMSNITISFNEFYSNKLAETTHSGMVSAAQKGTHLGGSPCLGYDVDSDGHYQVNPTEAKAVQRIFDLVELGYTRNQIADMLNEEGFRNKKGELFTKGSFTSILTNERLTGVYIWNRAKAKNSQHRRNNSASKPLEQQVRIDGAMPKIITPEQFQRVQELLKSRKGNGFGMASKHHYALSGLKLMKCKECGALLVGTPRSSHGVPYFTYSCPNHRKHTCSMKEIRVELVDKVVAKKLSEDLLNRTDWSTLLKLLNDNKELEHLQTRKLSTERAISGILKALEANYSDAILDRFRILQEEKEAIERQIDEQQSSGFDLTEEGKTLLRERFEDYIIHSTDPEARAYIKQNVEEILVDNKTVEVILNIA